MNLMVITVWLLYLAVAVTPLSSKSKKLKSDTLQFTEEDAITTVKPTIRQKRGHDENTAPYNIKIIKRTKIYRPKRIRIPIYVPNDSQKSPSESVQTFSHSVTHEHTYETPGIESEKANDKSYEIAAKQEDYGGKGESSGQEHYVESPHIEKVKVKHHHHHHHHIKTVVKKIPMPVEKIVHVPKPYPVEKIVEKVVHVPVEKIVHVPKPYPVEKVVQKVVHVPIEKIVHVPKPFPVEKIIHVPIEKVVHVPVERIVHKHIPVEKIVEKIIHVPKPYPVMKPVPYPVEVKVPVHIPQPYPVEKKVIVEVEKKPVQDPEPYKYDVPSRSKFYDPDYSSQGSRVHPIQTSQHAPSSQHNQQREIERDIQRPKYERSFLNNRQPHMFPQPDQSEQSEQSAQSSNQFGVANQQSSFNKFQLYHRNPVKSSNYEIQNAESKIRPSVLLPEPDGSQAMNNFQIEIPEKLRQQQSLVQQIEPTNNSPSASVSAAFIPVQLLSFEPIQAYPGENQFRR